MGLIGAGNFAKMTFVPAMKNAGFGDIAAVTSSGRTQRPPPRGAPRHRHRGRRRRRAARHGRRRHGLRAQPSRLARRAHRRAPSRQASTSSSRSRSRSSDDELDRRRRRSQARDAQLGSGFNRRHSECSLASHVQALGADGGPLVAHLPGQRRPAPRHALVQGPSPGRPPARRGLPLHRPRRPGSSASRSGPWWRWARGQAEALLQEDLVGDR